MLSNKWTKEADKEFWTMICKRLAYFAIGYFLGALTYIPLSTEASAFCMILGTTAYIGAAWIYLLEIM